MRQYKNKETENGCGGFGILLIFCWICFFGIRSFFEGVLFLLNIFPVILGILFVCCLISIASRDTLKYIFGFGVILGIFYLSGLVLYEVIHFICQHWIISLSVISVVIFCFFYALWTSRTQRNRSNGKNFQPETLLRKRKQNRCLSRVRIRHCAVESLRRSLGKIKQRTLFPTTVIPPIMEKSYRKEEDN